MTEAEALRPFDGIVRRLSITGAATGPLQGTTFVAKDLYDVAGYRTGAGTPDWERTHAPAVSTAPAIERCLSAGATLVGKACSDELAFSLDGVNAHYGTPINPRFPDRLPGGSSSGSASAVAAGLVDFALGSDTSGSIRVPASYCGVYGFRPTHGAVSTAAMVPLAPSFDTVGWLARDAAMLRRAGCALLGRADQASGPAAPFEALWVLRAAFDAVDAAYAAGVSDALDAARRQFARSADIRMASPLAAWLSTFNTLKQWEAWRQHGEWIRAAHPDLAPNIRANFEAAARVTDEARRRALHDRRRLLQELAGHLTRDVVVCLPSAWTIAPLRTAPPSELAENRMKDLALCSIASLAGAPQVSAPVAGAIGLGFIAAPGEDVRLLALAQKLAT